MMMENTILKHDLDILKGIISSTKNIGSKDILKELVDKYKEKSFTYKFVVDYIGKRETREDRIKFSTLRLYFYTLLEELRKNKNKFKDKEFYNLVDRRISYFNSAIQNTLRIIHNTEKYKKENKLIDYTNKELKEKFFLLIKNYLTTEEEIILKLIVNTYFETDIIKNFESVVRLNLDVNKYIKELFIKYKENENIHIFKRYLGILNFDGTNLEEELPILINLIKSKNIQSVIKNLQLKIRKYLEIHPNIVIFRYSFVDYVLHNVERIHNIEFLKYFRGLPEYVIY